MGVHLTSHTSITSALHEVESLCARSMALRSSYNNMVVIKHNKRELDLIARAWRFAAPHPSLLRPMHEAGVLQSHIGRE
jgi:hypothetical protein